MNFGQFDEKAREFRINTPDTPYPWINYLGTDEFFSIISNTAGGYAFYRDPKLRRITRYRYNDVPVDSNGRYFYLNDGKDVWSPSFKPVCAELDSYSCRHGMGYTEITGAKNGLEVSQLHFIPRGYKGEVIRLKVSNKSSSQKTADVFSFVEFCLWNALDDMTNFQRNFSTGEVEVENQVIYHRTEYRERRNHYSFFSCVSDDYTGFDTDRDSFLGRNRGLAMPQAVEAGKAGNSVCHGWHPQASHHLKMTLAPGESRTAVFVLGYAENPGDQKWDDEGKLRKDTALEMISKYDSAEKIAAGLTDLAEYWADYLSAFQISTPDNRIDRIINTWNQYQCMVTFNLARSASLFESGISRGIGFRDTFQDTLSCNHLVPQRVRTRILDGASLQFSDGSSYHQYQPLTKTGNSDIGGDFNDDPLWLPMGVATYIRETGDYSILDEQVKWADRDGETGSLLDHIRSSFRFTLSNLGPHGLPLIGRGDWNDCLNLNAFSDNPDESFQTCGHAEGGKAESVFIAGLFIFSGRAFSALCSKLGLDKEAEEMDKSILEMEAAVKAEGWDGEWFVRAYDHNGSRVGSSECPEGSIYIEPQGMCGMAEIGKDEGLPLKALDSVKNHLYSPYGIQILSPPYTGYHIELGEISSYPEGYKENGSIFCHNNPWVIIAETMAGRGAQAMEYHRTICPGYDDALMERHKTEPYVYSQMISGRDGFIQGEAKNSWLTGTASWSFFAFTQYVLGIRPDFDHLVIDPVIPDDWTGFTVERTCRGSLYHIEVKRASTGEGPAVKVDGKPAEGKFVPYFSDNSKHEVEVLL